MGPIELSPAAHMLHYAAPALKVSRPSAAPMDPCTCFGWIGISSACGRARALALPEPDLAQLADMVRTLIDRCREAVPEAPGALYLRPIIFGTSPNIGGATTPTTEALLVVLASPVWDYFSGGEKPLRILVDDQNTRSAAQMGMVKTGGNYAAALGPTMNARANIMPIRCCFAPTAKFRRRARRISC